MIEMILAILSIITYSISLINKLLQAMKDEVEEIDSEMFAYKTYEEKWLVKCCETLWKISFFTMILYLLSIIVFEIRWNGLESVIAIMHAHNTVLVVMLVILMVSCIVKDINYNWVIWIDGLGKLSKNRIQNLSLLNIGAGAFIMAIIIHVIVALCILNDESLLIKTLVFVFILMNSEMVAYRFFAELTRIYLMHDVIDIELVTKDRQLYRGFYALKKIGDMYSFNIKSNGELQRVFVSINVINKITVTMSDRLFVDIVKMRIKEKEKK